MRYGVSPPPRSTAGLVEKARLAEDLGLDLVGISDSQLVFREAYVTLGAVAAATERVAIGPVVTNPVTRHPAVTAGALATLDEFADGRAFLGLSSGDSAVHTVGDRPARLAELEATVELLRGLWSGARIEHEGTPLHLRWLAERAAGEGGAGDGLDQVNQVDHVDQVDVPIILAAEGPRTLRLAGAVADGVIVGLGLLPSVLETASKHIAQGAEAAGRDPDELEVWVFAKGHIDDDREAAIDAMKMALAASAHHSLQFSMEGKAVPERYRDRLSELVSGYDPRQHEQHGETTNRALVESLGLTDYLAERYGVLGTPADCVETIHRIRDTGLVDGILFSAYAADEARYLERLGTEVLPEC